MTSAPTTGSATATPVWQTPTAATPAQPPDAGPLADALSRVDALLALDTPESEAEAVALMRSLASSGAAPAFGGGQQVPKRPYSLDELRLNKIDAERYLSPNDSTLGGVRNALQVRSRHILCART